MELKDILKKRRLELGLTMKEVADACHVTEGMVSRWESGYTKNMRRDRIFALSQILRISPLVILGMEEYDDDTTSNNLKRFTDAISTMTDEEQTELMNYMNFIISKRK